MTAALLPPEGPPQVAFVAGDDGVDGITYVGGVPTAVIDGESVFLVLGAAGLGWGYYDHYHHWHGAPDRYRNHLERFHPGGHGLSGYDGFRHEEALRAREAAFRPGEVRPGMAAAAMRPEMRAGHPEGFRPAIAAAPAARPSFGAPAVPGRPGNVAMPPAHPAMAGPAAPAGFMRPAAAASAGGFRPAMPQAMRVAAPVARPAAPSGGGGRRK